MDAFEVERLRQQSQRELSESSSPKQKTLILKNFYQTLLNQTDKSLYEAFLIEFLEDFLDYLQKFEVFYCPPETTKDIIWILSKFLEQSILELNFPQITLLIKSLESELKQLIEVLSGKKQESTGKRKLYFPLLEKHLKSENNLLIGTLETLTINIKKNSEKDHFIIVPSFETIDKDLLSQIENSWQISTNYLIKNGKRISKYHTVIIHFDHHWGNYEGFSAGAALTLSFIEELVAFYNASVLISIKDNIAITGGFNSIGNAITIENQIIKTKLEMVFYSFIKTFIVPEENKASSINQLKELQKFYPKRDLEVVGINNLTDIINRRDLIAIKKQNPVIITAKYVKKNWAVSLLLLAFLLLTGHFYEINFDDNPAILRIDGNNLLVENSNGKVLWGKKIEVDQQFALSTLKENAKIIHIIGNNKNEVLFCRIDQSALINKKEYGSIFCFNYLGKELWHYQLRDTLKSYGEDLEPIYTCNLIDTTTFRGKELLVARACNEPSFSSAIFTIDLKSGKRIGTTFWNPGHITCGLIFPQPDNSKLIVFAGANNGYSKAIIGGIKLDEMEGHAPSTHYYTFKNIKPANLLFYILLPKTDYLKHYNVLRQSDVFYGSLINRERENKISVDIGEKDFRDASLIYKLDYNFRDISIVIDSGFRIERDTLVVHGILSPPFTDTPAFCKLMEDQILYWNGKKFVKKGQLK